MRVTSLVAVVVPRTGKSLKICYKMVYYTLYLDSVKRTFLKGVWHLKS